MNEDGNKELLKELRDLSKLSQSQKLEDEFIFRKISELDKKYKDSEFFFVNIDGIISNIGREQKSIKILNCVIHRLNQKKGKLPPNKYYYDIGNTLLSKAEIEYNKNFTYLIDSDNYREAVKYLMLVKKDSTDFYERAQTNIANVYEKYGRNYEAILAYDKILKVNPEFGMALGNKAIALEQYNKLSPYKSLVLLHNAFILLTEALNDNKLIDTGGQLAIDTFGKELKKIKEYFIKINYKPKEIHLPRNITKYEKFNLEHNLYLNYDFGYYYNKHSLLDSFFPRIVESLQDKPSEKSPSMSEKAYFSFQIFNQILEDYTTARFNFYKAMIIKSTSLDKKINYIYTFDYTKHCFKYGILQNVFASLCNCLDKVAHLIKFYFYATKIDPDEIVYFDKELTSNEFKQVLKKFGNFQLLALFSLAFDFKEGYPFNHLKKLRNRITHSFLNINPGDVYTSSPYNYEITEQMLIEDIFELFGIVKAAILYSVNSIYYTKGEGLMFSTPALFESDIYK